MRWEPLPSAAGTPGLSGPEDPFVGCRTSGESGGSGGSPRSRGSASTSPSLSAVSVETVRTQRALSTDLVRLRSSTLSSQESLGSVASLRSSSVQIDIRPPKARSSVVTELYERLGQCDTDDAQEAILCEVYDPEVLTQLLEMIDADEMAEEIQKREHRRMQDPRVPHAATLDLDMAASLSLGPVSPARGAILVDFSPPDSYNNSPPAAGALSPGTSIDTRGGAPVWNSPDSPCRGV